jgi:hypothetical protein
MRRGTAALPGIPQSAARPSEGLPEVWPVPAHITRNGERHDPDADQEKRPQKFIVKPCAGKRHARFERGN